MIETKIRITSELLSPSNSEDFEGVLSHATFHFSGNDFVATSPIRWNVRVVNGGEGFLYINGDAQAELKTQCVRCLDEARLNVNAEIEGFVKIKEGAKLPKDVGEDEFVKLEDGKYIDLSQLLKASILLNLPMQPLCDENCEGLFAYCDGHASQKIDDVQHPFEVLKNFEF